MCCELDYSNFHRFSLVGEDIFKRGWGVVHIDKTGKPIKHKGLLYSFYFLAGYSSLLNTPLTNLTNDKIYCLLQVKYPETKNSGLGLEAQKNRCFPFNF